MILRFSITMIISQLIFIKSIENFLMITMYYLINGAFLKMDS